MHEPPDAELWRSVETTLRTVVLPSLTEDWAKVAAVQLIGIARLAITRPTDDPLPARVAELAAALDGLRDHDVVAARWSESSDDPDVVLGAVSQVLAAVVAADDRSSRVVRDVLRPIVSRHLDEDLVVTAPLAPYFRGQLPDA